jgi:hypothetical protein
MSTDFAQTAREEKMVPQLRKVVMKGMAILAVITATTAILAPTAASATPGGNTLGTRPAVKALTLTRAPLPRSAHVTSAPSTASDLTVCSATAYGHTGYTYCEFVPDFIDWGGGNIEYFVIGLDFAIWHIWLGANGWQTLGGEARHFAPNGAFTYTHGVVTIGTDNNWWCRDWPWTYGWFRC